MESASVPGDTAWLQLAMPPKLLSPSSASFNPHGSRDGTSKGLYGDRGHPTVLISLKYQLWGWFGSAVAILQVRPCALSVQGSPLRSPQLLMGSSHLVVGARQIIVFLFLLIDIKRLPRGPTFSSFTVHLMPDVGYLQYQGDL